MYSPTLGRWMQQDPMGYVDGMSLYVGNRSNPTRFVDPAGLEAADAIKRKNDVIYAEPQRRRVTLRNGPHELVVASLAKALLYAEEANTIMGRIEAAGDTAIGVLKAIASRAGSIKYDLEMDVYRKRDGSPVVGNVQFKGELDRSFEGLGEVGFKLLSAATEVAIIGEETEWGDIQEMNGRKFKTLIKRFTVVWRERGEISIGADLAGFKATIDKKEAVLTEYDAHAWQVIVYGECP
jgi:uncharacterized protein RhaS with RHS repeats